MKFSALLMLLFFVIQSKASECDSKEVIQPFMKLAINQALDETQNLPENELDRFEKELNNRRENCPDEKYIIWGLERDYGKLLIENNRASEGVTLMNESYEGYLSEQHGFKALNVRSDVVNYYLFIDNMTIVSELIKNTINDCKSKLKTPCVFIQSERESSGFFVVGKVRYK